MVLAAGTDLATDRRQQEEGTLSPKSLYQKNKVAREQLSLQLLMHLNGEQMASIKVSSSDGVHGVRGCNTLIIRNPRIYSPEKYNDVHRIVGLFCSSWLLSRAKRADEIANDRASAGVSPSDKAATGEGAPLDVPLTIEQCAISFHFALKQRLVLEAWRNMFHKSLTTYRTMTQDQDDIC